MPTNNSTVKFEYLSYKSYKSSEKDGNTLYFTKDPSYIFLGSQMLANNSFNYKEHLSSKALLPDYAIEGDVYSVGSDNLLFRFNGSTWVELHKQKELDLENILKKILSNHINDSHLKSIPTVEAVKNYSLSLDDRNNISSSKNPVAKLELVNEKYSVPVDQLPIDSELKIDSDKLLDNKTVTAEINQIKKRIPKVTNNVKLGDKDLTDNTGLFLLLNSKVDKIEGKVLSTFDFNDRYRDYLESQLKKNFKYSNKSTFKNTLTIPINDGDILSNQMVCQITLEDLFDKRQSILLYSNDLINWSSSGFVLKHHNDICFGNLILTRENNSLKLEYNSFNDNDIELTFYSLFSI